MTTKQVYQLNENNVLVGVTTAQESPLEPGVFLIPAGCVDTDLTPISVERADQYVFWKDGNWCIGTYVYVDPNDPPTPEKIARDWRNSELVRADIAVNKVQDGDKTIGTLKSWRDYRVALRAWPEAEGFPAVTSRPVAPDFKEE